MCSSCPPREQLAAYLTGMLAEDLASKLEGHLTTCRRCESLLNELAARSRATDAPLRPSEAGDAMVVRPEADRDGAGVGQPGADYHLLFGLLALQNDFVSREELVTATSVWLLDKSRSLGDILRERGAIAEDEHQLLSALVAKHLAARQIKIAGRHSARARRDRRGRTPVAFSAGCEASGAPWAQCGPQSRGAQFDRHGARRFAVAG